METTLKKTPYDAVAQPYWEKKFLLSIHREKKLIYWIYQYDVKGEFFLTGDKKRKVEVSFQYVLTSNNSNFWEDDIKSGRKKSLISFRSPNLVKQILVDCTKKKN